MLPQQPMHWCMFPKCAPYRKSTFRTVTNPYDCEVDGVSFVGTSGQNINNMRQFGQIDDSLALLQQTIESAHLAPTTPDSLGCFPYYDDDPFILLEDQCPHVYFAGNQPEYGSKVIAGRQGQSVLILAVPDFHNSETAVLVNLRTLKCEPISFGGLVDSSELDK